MQKVGNVIKEFLVPEIRVKESYLLLKCIHAKITLGKDIN